jgi:hypothetical protein
MRLLLLATILAGCTMDASCPSGSTSLGTFAVTASPVDAGDTCFVTRLSDGGAADASLASLSSSTSLSFCAAETDAGTQLTLRFYGESARTVAIDGGAFSIETTSSVSGSSCQCAVDVTETFSGSIGIADGGVFGPDGDGGFTPIAKFTGRVDDAVSASNSGADCACNVPCAVHYALAAK